MSASASTTSDPSWAPNPNTTNRRDYTAAICSLAIPADANGEWASILRQARILVQALLTHPSMEPNLAQTFMTPANNKTRIYFLWDFVQRTIWFLNNCNPRNPSSTQSIWEDAVGRHYVAAELVEMKEMIRAIFPSDETPWGEEVERAAKDILQSRPDSKS